MTTPTKEPREKKLRVWKAWAGIVGTSIHRTVESDSKYPILAIYPSRRIAKLAYQCVVAVTITERKP